ncbi:MAG: type VII toxin-antitoxin system MntA family adenylyltransferase antitoxin [Clostridium neonatale]
MLGREIRDDIKNKEQILDIISGNEFKDIFLKKHINNVIIFGSLAKGQFTEESDIDIAVIPQTYLSFMDEINIESQLEELLGRNIDIININDESTNELIKIEALNSRFIVMSDDKLQKALDFYENYCKENEEFRYFLDKAVLYNE